MLAKNNTSIGSASIEVAQDGTVTISTAGYEVIGTVDENGTLTFGEVETTLPGIKLSKETLPIEPGQTGTLTVTFKKIPDTTPITWTSSDTTNKITVSNGTITVNSSVANGTTATITAKVTYNGTDYTKTCLITAREVIRPQVGDFVTYDAGTWTADETDGKIKLSVKDGNGVPSKIDANTSTNLPSSNWQFGGFADGSSKNENATPKDDSCNYVKDSSGSAVTGWRIFDITDDGITLISAGCPEDYYHPNETNYGYISEYILSGNINSNVNANDLGLGTSYKKRDWTADYGDSSRNITASVLTKSKLEDWYKKYVDSGTTDLFKNTTIFQKIFKRKANVINVINGGKYESLIDNYSIYWLASVSSKDYRRLCYFHTINGYITDEAGRAGGLRILVSLPSSISLKETPSGTKELVDPRDANNTYTYNVWDIK